jgi:hypothetical protein
MDGQTAATRALGKLSEKSLIVAAILLTATFTYAQMALAPEALETERVP